LDGGCTIPATTNGRLLPALLRAIKWRLIPESFPNKEVWDDNERDSQDNDEDVKGVKEKGKKRRETFDLSWVSAGRSAYR
jgi:hypothetical protein